MVGSANSFNNSANKVHITDMPAGGYIPYFASPGTNVSSSQLILHPLNVRENKTCHRLQCASHAASTGHDANTWQPVLSSPLRMSEPVPATSRIIFFRPRRKAAA